MFHKKRKRLSLPPGFISLAVLPVMLILFLKQHNVFKTDHCIQITFPLPDTSSVPRNDLFKFTTGFIKNLKKWDNTIYLTGNKETDKAKLNEFKDRIITIISNKDTIHGARIIYHPSIKFNTFIQLVNICLDNGVKCYAGTSDAFYAWTFIDNWKLEARQEIEIWGCGGMHHSNEETWYEKADRLKREEQHREFLLTQWPVALAFIPVFLAALIKIRLRRRK